ncbi:uncharacterized protein LOC144221029 [Crocuta crocuta]
MAMGLGRILKHSDRKNPLTKWELEVSSIRVLPTWKQVSLSIYLVLAGPLLALCQSGRPSPSIPLALQARPDTGRESFHEGDKAAGGMTCAKAAKPSGVSNEGCLAGVQRRTNQKPPGPWELSQRKEGNQL